MTATHHVHSHVLSPRNVFAHIVHPFVAMAQVIAGAAAASREYEMLSRMSDSQLAAAGLTRDDIPARVLRRLEA